MCVAGDLCGVDAGGPGQRCLVAAAAHRPRQTCLRPGRRQGDSLVDSLVIHLAMWKLQTLVSMLPAGATWSEGYFTFWIILSIVWGLVASMHSHSPGTAYIPAQCLFSYFCVLR